MHACELERIENGVLVGENENYIHCYHVEDIVWKDDDEKSCRYGMDVEEIEGPTVLTCVRIQ